MFSSCPRCVQNIPSFGGAWGSLNHQLIAINGEPVPALQKGFNGEPKPSQQFNGNLMGFNGEPMRNYMSNYMIIIC